MRPKFLTKFQPGRVFESKFLFSTHSASTLLTPTGKPAKSLDRTMLLARWVKHLNKNRNKNALPIIAAGMGKPTLNVNIAAVYAALTYWKEVLEKTIKVDNLIEVDEKLDNKETIDNIVSVASAIDYGEAQGNSEARKLISEAMTKWYETEITPEQILPVVGGSAAIFATFQWLKSKFPDSYVAMQRPYYGLHGNSLNKLHLIDVMSNEGYQFDAQTLQRSLKEAEKLNRPICAILICSPNNPLGTIISPDEWRRIAAVLREYPNTSIILDEAYAEMQLNGKKYLSLITVAPDLKPRTILFRSGTKGLSAAGERMATMLIFDPEIMEEMLAITVNINGHPPISLQMAFGFALSSITEKLLRTGARYYGSQVEYVFQTLLKMGAGMPAHHQYQPSGTFYVLCDLSELFNLPICKEATQALGKNGKASTDEEIAYNLLFKDAIMISPLSYYGLSNKLGYFRITCSEGPAKLNILMERLAFRLTFVRKYVQGKLLAILLIKIDHLSKKNPEFVIQTLSEIYRILSSPSPEDSFLNAKQLQENNLDLNLILQQVEKKLLQRPYRPFFFVDLDATSKLGSIRQKASFIVTTFDEEIFANWSQYHGLTIEDGESRSKFFELNFEEKLEFLPLEKWKIFIEQLEYISIEMEQDEMISRDLPHYSLCFS